MADKETKHGTLLSPLLGTDLIGIQREPDEIHYKSPLSGVVDLTTIALGVSYQFIQLLPPVYTVGELLNVDAAGAWALADADNSLPCHAMVTVVNGFLYTVAFSGYHKWLAHGLTLGAYYYLSTTPGGVVTPKPGVPGQIIQRALLPIDANTVVITIGEAWT